MNRYPTWKYVLILVVLALGLVYTLPNLFGEVPAVQVGVAASARATADASLLARCESILKAQGLADEGATLDATGVKIRLRDPDTQLKAKDALQGALGDSYTVALALLPSSPAWLTALGATPINLGLDLRGGVYFLMQVDMAVAINKQLDRETGDVRTMLRDAKVPLAGVDRQGQALVITFRDQPTLEQGEPVLRKGLQSMQLTRLDDTHLSATLDPVGLKTFEDQAVDQNILTLRNRINELGAFEPAIQRDGTDRVVVQLPGVQDTARAKEILGRTASLEIHMVDDDHMDPADLAGAIKGQVPPGDDFYPTSRDGAPILIKKAIVLTGEDIANASAGFDQQQNTPAVFIRLDTRGARIFANVTRDNVGKRMAILLIDQNKGEVVTAPVIRQEIDGGNVQITGSMTTADANEVALLLRAGALAAPMEIIEERTIGPSLGAENIDKGVRSVIGGFLAVAVFMMVYYNLMGVFSALALAANVLLLVALLSVIPDVTLTLPGMAGIALTVGMAIDANVLINERVREELRNGQTAHAAIAAGYQRAFGTIFDSNVTNLIAGIALAAYGSGPVRGFAVVLCLGIATSIFSAVVVSRALVNLTYGRKRRLQRISI